MQSICKTAGLSSEASGITFSLPIDDVIAKLEEGVLRISIPKKEKIETSKRIMIE